MNEFLTSLNQPFFLTLFTLLIGGYAFKRFSERRAREERVKDKAIEFLEEVGSDINPVLSLLAGHIRFKRTSLSEELRESTGLLFTKRFSVRIKSKAYLESEEFWKDYDKLVWEIREMTRFLVQLPNRYEGEKIITEIQEHQAKLSQKWPLEDREFSNDLESPFNELKTWSDMIWNRSVWLLSSYLEQILKK